MHALNHLCGFLSVSKNQDWWQDSLDCVDCNTPEGLKHCLQSESGWQPPFTSWERDENSWLRIQNRFTTRIDLPRNVLPFKPKLVSVFHNSSYTQEGLRYCIPPLLFRISSLALLHGNSQSSLNILDMTSSSEGSTLYFLKVILIRTTASKQRTLHAEY